MRLEVVVIPVADAERSKRFYTSLGWRLDADFAIEGAFRVVQFTPPGSECSIHFGVGVTSAAPGSARLYLVVPDVVATREELIARNVRVSDVVHRLGPGKAELAGPHPQRQSYASFASFSDPDGNAWIMQEITLRLPGRVATTNATFTSSGDLEAALRRAEVAHGEHEKRTGARDEEWPRWYAEYMLSEQTGKPLPT
ncbi:VOC family protein [Steroidobacter cummioxidans]|uniref:VOC family protein n=1 Tax=Steroidobacter cummioxidans TaxID=1803913 RepID=UPI000E313A40